MLRGSSATTGWSKSSARLTARRPGFNRWLTATDGNYRPPPLPLSRDIVDSLRLVNGSLDFLAQEDSHPYRNLPWGFYKHLRGALLPPWIIGRNSMTAWEARVVGVEWMRE